MDADTYELNGGSSYYKQARDIVNYSQQSGFKGWEPPIGGAQTRSALINNILSPTFKDFHLVLFNYHFTGLDVMAKDVKKGKIALVNSLMKLENLNKSRPNSFLLRVFFDAKVDEITDVFSDGPSVNMAKLASMLTKVAPMHSSKWKNIKF